MKVKIKAMLVLVLVISGVVFAQWTPDVMIKFKRVEQTAISPDGNLIAYTVSVPIMEGEKSEYLTHIWVVSSDGKMNYQFTFGEKSCTAPAFSPDGKYLAFLSARGSDGKNQIWLLRLTGGEAEQITKVKTGVISFKWSPDSRKIAFTSTDPETEEEMRAKKEKLDMIVVDKNFKYAHIYVVSLDEKEKGEYKIKRITKGDFHVTSFDWSPDGKYIVFSHQVNPTADAWTTSDISIVPSDSGEVKPLIKWNGSDSNPRFSPDGKWIAFESDGGTIKWAGLRYVYIIPSTGGEAKRLAPTYDENCRIIDWSADSKSVYVSEAYRTTWRIYALPIDGGKPRPLTPDNGNYTGVSFSKNGKAMAFIYQNSETPPDVYVTDLKKFEPKKLTDVNSDFPKYPLGKTEVITWRSKDGLEIEGLVTYPVNFERGRKYPLVLLVHGGPAGVFTQSYTAAGAVYPIQAFAQEGYVVLRPNPRGSSGYGKDFRFANYEDWGFGDYEDLMAGVDKLIEMGIVHPESLCVAGWSYGGYMTSFVVTKTKRFKAASVGAGVTNLISFTGTADIPSFLPDYFRGEFWDKVDVYMKHSAIFNVKGVTTPTQIIHGEADVRVPVSQGKEFYNALKRQGCPTEMIIYPRTPHGVQEPKFIADIGKRIIAWFNKNLGRDLKLTGEK
jgi:dipeptidyl aminopeptidase/acylaminoacyl peptidase